MRPRQDIELLMSAAKPDITHICSLRHELYDEFLPNMQDKSRDLVPTAVLTTCQDAMHLNY
jgi:hypothetical protein